MKSKKAKTLAGDEMPELGARARRRALTRTLFLLPPNPNPGSAAARGKAATPKRGSKSGPERGSQK
jgi:hypothetical protein